VNPIGRLRQAYDDAQRWFVATHQGPPLDRPTLTVLTAAAVLLTVFYYYGRSRFYSMSGLHDVVMGALPPAFDRYADLMPFVWWAFHSVFLRVAIPVLLLRWLYKQPASEFGLRFRGLGPHMPVYFGLYLFMLPFLVVASTLPSFQQTYPFYDRLGEGWDHFILYELAYGLQFLGVEFFFRGFLLFALFSRFGWYGLLISAIPYVMIHFNKPIAETLGALVAGCLLGALAIRSRSVIPGVLLHWAIAITMDVLALLARTDPGR
jgi:membrane protease YdiL (CAAX protease family)